MKKILLVEDDECLRESLRLILTESGLDITSFPEGRSALKELQRTNFDAIILDDNLPFIQGTDLLGLIRIENPTVKIVIMSGLFNAEGIKKIKALGADMVIEKPFDFNMLIDFLKKI